MDSTAVMLPLCVALALIGLLATVVLWRSRRASRGRILQGLAWTLVPVALYLTGLLQLAWNAVVALLRWAGQVAFSPAVWIGFSLLGVAVVLLVVGAVVVRRSHLRAGTGQDTGREPAGRREVAAGRGAAPAAQQAGQRGGQQTGKQQSGKQQVDDEMAEIEALLKSRGIE